MSEDGICLQQSFPRDGQMSKKLTQSLFTCIAYQSPCSWGQYGWFYMTNHKRLFSAFYLSPSLSLSLFLSLSKTATNYPAMLYIPKPDLCSVKSFTFLPASACCLQESAHGIESSVSESELRTKREEVLDIEFRGVCL